MGTMISASIRLTSGTENICTCYSELLVKHIYFLSIADFISGCRFFLSSIVGIEDPTKDDQLSSLTEIN